MLAVTIAEHGDQVLVSVATISSVHLLKFPHPNRLQQKSHDDTQAFAIFHEATVQQIGARDQSLFHVIGHAATPSKIFNEFFCFVFFSNAYSIVLYRSSHSAYGRMLVERKRSRCLFLAGLSNQFDVVSYAQWQRPNNIGRTQRTVHCAAHFFEHHRSVAVGFWLNKSYDVCCVLIYCVCCFSFGAHFCRGKGGAMTDSQYATSLIFNELDDVVFLYGLYRDDNVRMWSSRSGQCVATVNCVQNIHEQRLLGCELMVQQLCFTIFIYFFFNLTLDFMRITAQTNTLRRASSTLICAFLCASSGSEFVTIRTINDGGNYTMHRLDLVPAPEFDLVEFDVNENRIWGLWCNSQGEITQFFGR